MKSQLLNQMPRAETTLTLRRAIWNQDARRSVMNRVLTQSAAELEDKLKNNIDASTPAGRLYARGHTTARRSAATRRNRPVPGTKTRVIIAARVFRSSAVGQPPARRFDTLYNSLRAKRVPGKLQILASVNAPGVDVLDDPGRLRRPFFRSVIASYRSDEFVDRIRGGVRELLG